MPSLPSSPALLVYTVQKMSDVNMKRIVTIKLIELIAIRMYHPRAYYAFRNQLRTANSFCLALVGRYLTLL